MEHVSTIEQVYHTRHINRSLCVLRVKEQLIPMKQLLDAHLYTTLLLGADNVKVGFHEIGLCSSTDDDLQKYIDSNEECDTIFCYDKQVMLQILKFNLHGKLTVHQLT